MVKRTKDEELWGRFKRRFTRREWMMLFGCLPVVLSGGAAYGPEQTLTLQPDATAGKDTYLKSNAANTNYGTNTAMWCGEYPGLTFTERGLIQFDLSTIPSNAVVVSAALKLYLYSEQSSNASVLAAYRLKRAWVEAEATWNIYSTGNSWQTAGGFGANDCEQTDIGSVALSATPTLNQFYSIALNAAKVQEWIAGTFANNGVLLRQQTELDNDYAFYTSDWTTGASRPILEVVYKVPFDVGSVRSHTRLADAPVAAEQMAFEELGGLLYWVCGRKSDVHSQGVYAYNPATNEWTQKADYPIAVQSLIVRAVNGKLYGIGGHHSQVPVTFYGNVYEYDPVENTWTQKESMPTPREDFGSAVVDGKIYCFGGLTNSPADYTPTKALEIYDPATNTWDITKADMPDYKMEGDFGAAYGGKIYAIGSTNTFASYPYLAPVKAVYMYDPALDSWAAKADIPLPTCYKEVEVLGDKLYVVAGSVSHTPGTFSHSIYEYDTVGDTWTLKNAATGAPYATAGYGLAAYSGNLYMCGGVANDNSKLNYLYRLTIGL